MSIRNKEAKKIFIPKTYISVDVKFSFMLHNHKKTKKRCEKMRHAIYSKPS